MFKKFCKKTNQSGLLPVQATSDTGCSNNEHVVGSGYEVHGRSPSKKSLVPHASNIENNSSLSSATFEGFIPQIGYAYQSEGPYQISDIAGNGMLKASLAEMGFATSQICFVEFSSNGKYLICVECKLPENYTVTDDCCSWNKYIPVSQILILECYTHNLGNKFTYPFVFKGDTVNPNRKLALALKASLDLEFIAIHCVCLSKTNNLLAICGFNSKDKPRNPTVQVYEIKNFFNNNHYGAYVTKVSKFSFTRSGILTAKVTACAFSPSSEFILVTCLCDDFVTFTKTNYIDFWNSQLGEHLGRIDLNKEATYFRGYITLLSFSMNGSIIAIFSSAVECQILLYSIVKSKLGKMTSVCPVNYYWSEKHCSVFGQFVPVLGENCFVVCTSNGLLSRLTIDAENLTITVNSTLQLSYSLFQNIPDISENQLTSIVGFLFCSATSRYFIRTNMLIIVMDPFADTVEKVVKLDHRLHDNISTNCMINTGNISMSLSKTGHELVISKRTEINVFLNQNNDISLVNLCRQKIIRLVTENKIKTLPLPKSLQNYLLFGKC